MPPEGLDNFLWPLIEAGKAEMNQGLVLDV